VTGLCLGSRRQCRSIVTYLDDEFGVRVRGHGGRHRRLRGGAGRGHGRQRPTQLFNPAWIWIEQPIWAAQVKRLKVGSARRFSATTRESLVADLRSILAAQHVTRAREVATRMSKPAESVTAVADLLEETASRRGFG
jgi:hypothetical protein